MNRDTIAIVVIVVALAVLIWLIQHAVRAGKWRYRFATVYRDKNPMIFWGTVVVACAVAALVVFMVFVILIHQLYCDAKGTPGACFEKFTHTFVG